MFARERSFEARGSRMIGALRAGLMTAVLVIGCSDHGGGERVARGTAPVGGGVAPAATSVAEQMTGFARTDAGAYVGFHLGPRFSSTIDDRGAQISGLDAKWTMGLHVARIGRAGAMRRVGQSAPSATKERVELARGGGVTEWFALRDRGLEHGIDVSAPPAGAGDLVIEVAVEGRTAVALDDGQQVELRDTGSATTLTYGELSVKDADGRDVAARMDVVSGTVTMTARDEGARYPLVIDPLVWAQQAKLVATDGAAGDSLGYSVALNGTTVIVGANFKNLGSNTRQGAAYVFIRSGSTWVQQARLTSADGAAQDAFGTSVALSGSTAVVGASGKTIGSNDHQGAAYVFVRSGTAWSQQDKLVANDGATGEFFGTSVALDGPIAVVGATGAKVGSNRNQGAAYVFVQSGTSWSQQGKLVATDGAGGDYFGQSVALSGTAAIVGAGVKKIGSNTQQGAAYVFAQSGTTWTQQAQLVATDGAGGDWFGSSVALSGPTAIVGAQYKKIGTKPGQGAAYVFVQSGTTWTQQARLVGADGANQDHFGQSVALGGSTAVVGAPNAKVGTNLTQGAAYVFAQSGTTWTQQEKLVSTDGAKNDLFSTGVGLSASGSTAIVGAYSAKVGSNNSQGAAYVFAYPHPAGDPCTLGADCVSNFCADVCCDRACDGKCEACSAAKKGSGVDGTCGFVADGADPSASCGPPVCAAKTLTEHVCDGKGGCRDKTTDCAPVECDAAGNACLKKCNTNAECATGLSCVGGVCGGPPNTQSPTPSSGKSGCGCVMPGTTKDGEYPWTIATLGILAVLTRVTRVTAINRGRK